MIKKLYNLIFAIFVNAHNSLNKRSMVRNDQLNKVGLNIHISVVLIFVSFHLDS